MGCLGMEVVSLAKTRIATNTEGNFFDHTEVKD